MDHFRTEVSSLFLGVCKRSYRKVKQSCSWVKGWVAPPERPLKPRWDPVTAATSSAVVLPPEALSLRLGVQVVVGLQGKQVAAAWVPSCPGGQTSCQGTQDRRAGPIPGLLRSSLVPQQRGCVLGDEAWPAGPGKEPMHFP